MKIGLITYNRPHRKTYELACMLKMEGYEVALLIVPFVERKERTPLIQHRLEGTKYHPNQISEAFGFKKSVYGSFDVDIYLIGGCNILPGLKARNAHPGFLPYVRGLDALKWSIHYGVPIGVTVHETTDEPDQGPIYTRKVVPLYFEDTFHSFAERVYQYEIQMLVDSLQMKATFKANERTPLSEIIHRRMPAHTERIMLEKFEALRKKQKSIYEAS